MGALLDLPIGNCLSEGNWESHVYELGNTWVYKEIKKPDSIGTEIKNFEMRRILQAFWNSDTHYQNMQKDYEIFKSAISTTLPTTFFFKGQSLLKHSTPVIISVQERLFGTLLKDKYDKAEEVKNLAKSVREVCESVFTAPADFHPGNLLITDSGKLYFFDTGTPSDWEYFKDAEKFSHVTNTSLTDSSKLVDFIKPIYDNHWQKLIGFSR